MEFCGKAVKAMNKELFCVAVALDIKNAFNSAGWAHILSALESWKVPGYLMRVFRSYFAGRKAYIENPHSLTGLMDVPIMWGVPQGSVVGPLLWNITYNSVLKTVLPKGAELIGFADDTFVVAYGRTTSEFESTANVALEIVVRKISNLDLAIAMEKTQAVIFTYNYKYTPPNLTISTTLY